MNDEELTLWEEEDSSGDEQEISLWEEEKSFGENGDEDISLWSDNEELPPVSELLLKENDKLTMVLPEGFKDWEEVFLLYLKFFNLKYSPDDADQRPFRLSLDGAFLYGSDDKGNRWKGSELIKEAAKKRDAVGMRQRAVVLLEGLICERDPEAALKWLHMAARAGDLKALRILVYSLFGMEKILVAPREDAKREDAEGRFIKVSDLFDGVNISDAKKLLYVKKLIELTKEYHNLKSYNLLWRRPISKNRQLITLVYGYLIQAYEMGNDHIDTKNYLKDWGKSLYEEIHNEPLYDGLLIRDKESGERQIANLCRIFGVEEEDLEKPIILEWNPRRDFKCESGYYVYLQGTAKNISITGSRLDLRKSEIQEWSWKILRKIVCEDYPDLYFAPFYVYCMKQLVEQFFQKEIDFYDKKGAKKYTDVLEVFNTNRYLAEWDDYSNGYSGYSNSTDYKYLIIKEKQFWERVKKIPDYTRRELNLISPEERKDKIKEYIKECTKYYSAEEFSALKEAAAGNEWPLEASYLLGLRYEYGQGTEADWSEAVKCFKRAERSLLKDNSKKHLERLEPQTEFFREMKNLLPLLHSPQAATAAERIKEMAEKGFSPAMVVMAKQMLESEQFKRADYFFPYDPSKGLKLLKDAAELQNMSAMYELILIGRNGKYGFEPDESFATKYKLKQDTTIYTDLLLK